MAYTAYTWKDGAAGGTPIVAARLNAIEGGLSATSTMADSALVTANSATSTATSAAQAAAAAQTTANAAASTAANSYTKTQVDSLLATKAPLGSTSGSTGGGGAGVSIVDNGDGTYKAVGAGFGGVLPESYVQSTDGANWAPAITRALAYATPLGLPVLLQKIYPISTTISLNSNDTLIGQGPRTGIVAPLNTPMTLLTASGATGVTLDNFSADGNCVTYNGATKARGIRFVNCTNVRTHRLTVQYVPDWGTSFEQCTNVLVTDHVHRAGDSVQFGGRDGVHFLDCSDVLLDGARIHSGDDCVGITSETRNITRITVRNVTGVSEIAAVVTVGNEGTTSFNASQIAIDNISTYHSPDFTGESTYILKLRAQNASFLRGVQIGNINGTAVSHGVYIEGNNTTPDSVADLTMSNVVAFSTTNHGIFISQQVRHFTMSNCFGQSQSGLFDGINISACSFGVLSGCSARASALWGLQLNGCVSFDVVGFMSRDNGGVNFSGSNGGNGRIVNCSDVQVIGGQFAGGTSTSYFGLSQSGNTTTTVSTMTRTAGAH